MLEQLKREVCQLNRALPAHHLIAWTSGNVSVRDPESGLVVIKPSGVAFEALEPEDMVIVDANNQTTKSSKGV